MVHMTRTRIGRAAWGMSGMYGPSDDESVATIRAAVDAGDMRAIGLSEVGSDTIRRAAAVHPIEDLQIEYSLLSRGIEDDILQTCRELGIKITA